LDHSFPSRHVKESGECVLEEASEYIGWESVELDLNQPSVLFNEPLRATVTGLSRLGREVVFQDLIPGKSHPADFVKVDAFHKVPFDIHSRGIEVPRVDQNRRTVLSLDVFINLISVGLRAIPPQSEYGNAIAAKPMQQKLD